MAAAVAASAFAASPVFAGVEPQRYRSDAIASRMSQGKTYLAIADGRIAGCATLFAPDLKSPCEHMAALPSIGYVAVTPHAAGCGVGDALMDFVEAAIKGPEVALSVTQRGADLIAWYERRGYRKVAVFHWPEAQDPSWIMVKRLKSLAEAD